MRIAYVTDAFLPADATDTIQLVSMASAFGEAGATLRLLLPAQRARVPDTATIAAHYGVSPTFTAVPIVGPYPAPLAFRGLEKVTHAVKMLSHLGDADVVYTRNLPVALSALTRTRLPVFYETYRPWPAQQRSKAVLFRRLLKHPRFAGLVLHSQLAADSYAALGYEAERLLVAHNGIDAQRFAEPGDRDAARAALGLSDARPIALYSGHVSAAKGIGIILEAAERLPQVRFAIVGSKEDGPIERRAATLANVSVHPWQAPAAVAQWLAAADMLLIPPTRGPLEKVGNTVLPIKTFQYLASGRVVVGPSTPDLAEVLHDNVNARLVTPDDLPAFVKVLAELGTDPTLRARLGDAGRAAALSNTWKARAERILAFIGRRTA